MRKKDIDPILLGPPIYDLPQNETAYNLDHNRDHGKVDVEENQWHKDMNKYYKKRLLEHRSSLGEDDSPDYRKSIVG